MAVFSDEGYIIKRRDFLEADVIITVFTKYHGKIEAVVKGARRSKSRKAGYIDYLNKLKFLFAEGRSLNIVTEIEPLNIIESEDHEKAFIFFTAEVINQLFPEEMKIEDLYNLFSKCFTEFVGTKDEKYLLYFIFQTLLQEGYTDFQKKCVVCGKALNDSTKKLFFNSEKNGFTDGCTKDLSNSNIKINLTLLKILLFFDSHDIVDIKPIAIKRENKVLLFSLINEIIKHIADRQLKSFYMLNRFYNDQLSS